MNMSYLEELIAHYKSRRSRRELHRIYTRRYALVGLGGHCVSNLLPVIQHLQLPLKYICCTSREKAELISRKYKDVIGTTSLQTLLQDEEIAGIFVAAHPDAHFQIASAVLKARKALFIEKPPCRSKKELEILIELARQAKTTIVVVGLQRRFAPATEILQKRLRKEKVHHYHYRYLTGLYPEGDALLDLFIHPLDYVVFLFGKAKLKAMERVEQGGGQTLFLILEHHNVMGVLEVSTDYSWQEAQELLNVNTKQGIYRLDNLERLDFVPKRSSVLGIPLEKVLQSRTGVVTLYGRNAFLPTTADNQLVSQGFFSEIRTFADKVEHQGKKRKSCASDLECIQDTYWLISEIREYLDKK